MIYFDHAATAGVDPRILSATVDLYQSGIGNAGSLHPLGEKSAKVVDRAREQVANLIGADSREIIFTSGATESNNLAILGVAEAALADKNKPKRIVTFATEHKCVLQAAWSLSKQGFDVVTLPVDQDGTANLVELKKALEVPTLLVSVMKANNEIGTINNIQEISSLVKAANALLHVDMAQAAGKVPLDIEGVDLASISGHKMYGPQGIGALYIRRRPRTPILPRTLGGGQERGMRSGTLPVALIFGLGMACELAQKELKADLSRLRAMQGQFERDLTLNFKNVSINGSGADRLPGYTNISLPPSFTGADVAKKLGAEGIMTSFGSACTAGSGGVSYVLEALGQDKDKAGRGLRITAGRFTTEAEYKRLEAVLSGILS